MAIIKNKKNGFTLVEVIVVGLLLTILALGIISLFIMYSENARETTANMRLHRQSEALTDEIARQVRAANLILPVNADVWAYDPTATPNPVVLPPPVPPTGILLYNNDRDTVGGYEFRDDGIVMEYADGDWRPFRIDGHDVEVDGNVNNFGINQFGNELTVNARFRTEINNRPFVLNVERGVFRCRISFTAN